MPSSRFVAAEQLRERGVEADIVLEPMLSNLLERT